MTGLVERALANGWARRIIGGSLLGALTLAVVLVLRARQHDTLVLQVQPIGDATAIRVYVGGAVTTPGLYTLPRGSRVAEALDAAGGAGPNADTSKLGMAAPLEDADQVIVPERRATQSAATAAPQATTGAAATPPESPTTATTPTPAGPIDINSATAAELDGLPGIGPTLAQRIVDYRETNGPFQTIEELADVRGISDAMVEELRSLITIGS